ncbi:MAG: methyltransferase domain-containing protein [Dermatophilaceae bacterium]
MRDHSTWDPVAYARFAGQRGRPFADLVAQVRVDDPGLVVDLGCGDGPLTSGLAAIWPGARIVGVDSSETMLEAARARDPQGRVEWVQADLRAWDVASLGEPPGVILTAATLQWVPSHLDLFDAWVAALAPGGWLAVQVPGNFDAPSHRLMREVATRHPRAAELAAVLDRPHAGEPATYLRYLTRLGCAVDVWETTYLHVLPAEGDEHPVLSWVRGTGLRPVLDLLADEAERAAFLDPYAAALDRAYPRGPEGVVFPFRRVFAVASTPAG